MPLEWDIEQRIRPALEKARRLRHQGAWADSWLTQAIAVVKELGEFSKAHIACQPPLGIVARQADEAIDGLFWEAKSASIEAPLWLYGHQARERLKQNREPRRS